MPYHLSPHQIEEIESKLPPQYAALKDKYPVAISNVAEYWDIPSYPSGYVPQLIEIYYEDEADDSAIFIKNGQLVSIRLENTVKDPTVIMMEIDDQWAYIQLEGRIILDRRGGAILPDVVVNPSVLLSTILLNLPAR